MRMLRTVSRAALPLVTAVVAVGLVGTPALPRTEPTAAPDGPEVAPVAFVTQPPPPRWIRREDCERGGGRWDHDRRDLHLWHCIGGRWDRHDGRW